jgi:hypothetical protein
MSPIDEVWSEVAVFAEPVGLFEQEQRALNNAKIKIFFMSLN